MVSLRNWFIGKLFILYWVAVLSCSGSGHTEQAKHDVAFSFPQPVGMVNDFSGILHQSERDSLEQKMRRYEELSGNQIVVVSIDNDTLKPENFLLYSVALGNYWGVGKKAENNGLMIVFSPVLRKIRINTGYGTERILTDEICNEVLTQFILPQFKQGNYYEGLRVGIDELIIRWK